MRAPLPHNSVRYEMDSLLHTLLSIGWVTWLVVAAASIVRPGRARPRSSERRRQNDGRSSRTHGLSPRAQVLAVVFVVGRQVFVAVNTKKAADHESEGFFETPAG